jgi:hypothetical protein
VPAAALPLRISGESGSALKPYAPSGGSLRIRAESNVAGGRPVAGGRLSQGGRHAGIVLSRRDDMRVIRSPEYRRSRS